MIKVHVLQQVYGAAAVRRSEIYINPKKVVAVSAVEGEGTSVFLEEPVGHIVIDCRLEAFLKKMKMWIP